MATFGKTTLGVGSSASSTDKMALSQATPSESGTIKTGHARLWLSDSGSTSVKFAIYSGGSTPGSLLAESSVVTVSGTTSNQLYTFPFPLAEQIRVTAGTSYWIGVFWADPGGASIEFGRDSESNLRREYTLSWPTLPSFAGSGSPLSGPLALYVTYETATPVPIADVGTGAQTVSVDRLRFLPLTDAATGADAATTFAENPPTPDAGTGAETISIEVLIDVAVSDAGLGAETIEVADFFAHELTDAGTGLDSIEVIRTNFVDLTDAGSGLDSTGREQQRALTDVGQGLDRTLGLRTTTLGDAGEALDWIRVVDIPFTQVLPLVEGTIYDLVVVARVPRVSGPPTFVQIDPIDWSSLSYSNTLSEPQELAASCLISSVPDSIWGRLRSLHDLPTELWLYRDGQVVFAGPMVGWQTAGENLNVSCKGLLGYLDAMVVHTDQRFKSDDQHLIVQQLVNQWQALEFGHFGIDTSAITPSGQLRTEDFLRDELHTVGKRVEEMSKLALGFDAEVDPASRQLQLWHPTKGVDRSMGEDAIVFDQRNITSGDILASVAGGDLASEAYGTSGAASDDEGLKFSLQSNLELRARYGRTAVTGTWSDIKEQSALDLQTQGLLEARGRVLLVPGPKLRVTPDADLADYGVGDVIAYDLASQIGINGSFRIRKQTVTVEATGQESVDLEFV